MGIYLNPDNGNYKMAVDSEIFVDKTEMLLYLNSVINTQQRYVSVSRPRRFGKTMAADMICAYYCREADSRELFEGLKLADTAVTAKNNWDSYLGQFDVIRVVMTRFIKEGTTVEESLDKMQRLVVREMHRAYPDVELFDSDSIVQSMDDIYSVTNRRFVVVIDEWDAVFRELQNDKDGQTKYLNFLRDWIKDNSCIALAYITGILPIKKYGKHSALNMFTEYSMTAPANLHPLQVLPRKKLRNSVTGMDVILKESKIGMMDIRLVILFRLIRDMKV